MIWIYLSNEYNYRCDDAMVRMVWYLPLLILEAPTPGMDGVDEPIVLLDYRILDRFERRLITRPSSYPSKLFIIFHSTSVTKKDHRLALSAQSYTRP